MKYKIEKNTVQETLIIPLYARKMCSELYPNLYRDGAASQLVRAVDYDFSALEQKSRSLMQRFGFLEVAMRQNDLAVGCGHTHFQPGLYAGLQRPERPIGQRILPLPCQGWRWNDEDADRKDRIWRENMKRPEKRMCLCVAEWKGAK